MLKISINNLCRFGQQAWTTRNLPGVSVEFPGKSPLKFFPLGLYYLAKGHLTSVGPDFHQPITADCFVEEIAAGPARTGLNILFNNLQMVANGNGSGVGMANGRMLVNKQVIEQEIRRFSLEISYFSPEEIAHQLENRFRVPINKVYWFVDELVSEGILVKAGTRFYRLNELVPADEKIELEKAMARAKTSFDRFQLAVESRISDLNDPECNTLQRIWTTFLTHSDHENRKDLGWRGVYWFVLNAKGEMLQVNGTSSHEPSYLKAQKPRALMKSVLEGQQELYRIRLEDDLENTIKRFQEVGLNNVDPNWVQDTLLRYGIGTINLLKLSSADGQPIGVLLLRDPVYFGSEHQSLVNESLIDLSRAIGSATGRVIAKQALPDPDTLALKLFSLVKTKCKIGAYGAFGVGRIENPAVNITPEDMNLLVDALNWQKRDREDMRKHLSNVTELVIVFCNGIPVAFGTGNEVDFNNMGQQEKHLKMVGTMSRPEFYGHSLQTLVNGLFLLKRRQNFKRDGGWNRIKAPIVMMRTRSVAPAVGFLQYFSAVKFEDLSGREFERAAEFNRHMGEIACDRHGVVKNAYEEPISDIERDIHIMQNLSKRKPKVHILIAQAFNGLSLLDARTFQGKLRAWDAFKIWLYINVIFKYAHRRLATEVQKKIDSILAKAQEAESES